MCKLKILSIILVLIFTLIGYSSCRKIVQKPFDAVTELNNSPIIGVLSQEITKHLSSRYPDKYYSFIAASYIKFVEGGGARAVPIWIGKDRQYYTRILSKVNGVLLPGGASWFYDPNGYAEAGEHIFEIATELNKKGSYFPIWGTCLGFELLTFLDANRTEHRSDCESDKQPLPLHFKPDFRTSRMFKDAPDNVIDILASEDVTANFHQFCTTEKNLTAFGLDNNWRVVSTNEDWNGFTFISTMEHKRYPYYGVQFHPEKNIYEWIPTKNITRSSHAIKASQYFAQFFVDETRKNFHKFEDRYDEDKYLIYNYQTTFTGLVRSVYDQCYLFEHADTSEFQNEVW